MLHLIVHSGNSMQCFRPFPDSDKAGCAVCSGKSGQVQDSMCFQNIPKCEESDPESCNPCWKGGVQVIQDIIIVSWADLSLEMQCSTHDN